MDAKNRGNIVVTRNGIFETVLDTHRPWGLDPAGYALGLVVKETSESPAIVQGAIDPRLAPYARPFIYGLSPYMPTAEDSDDQGTVTEPHKELTSAKLLNLITRVRLTRTAVQELVNEHGLLFGERQCVSVRTVGGGVVRGVFMDEWLREIARVKCIHILTNRAAGESGSSNVTTLAGLDESAGQLLDQCLPAALAPESRKWLIDQVKYFKSFVARTMSDSSAALGGGEVAHAWLADRLPTLRGHALAELNEQLAQHGRLLLLRQCKELRPVLKFDDAFGHAYGAIMMLVIGYDRFFVRCANPACNEPLDEDAPRHRKYCCDACRFSHRESRDHAHRSAYRRQRASRIREEDLRDHAQ